MGLPQWRKKINSIDNYILDLLNKRTELVLKIGNYKEKHSKEIYSPEREYEIYRKLAKLNKGPLSDKALKAIYREIMSGAISLQKRLTVAYLGPEATFTHEAARSKFGSSVEYMPVDSIGDIFGAVEKGYADYGVVPIENSIDGAVTHTLDMFIDSDLKVCAEIPLKISHNLLCKHKEIGKIKKLYSKSQVFAQCRTWLKTNLPKVDLIEVSSTAKAAQKATKEQNGGALSSRLAAELYNLNILKTSIEDMPNNVTKFLVIGKKSAGVTGKDKTSVLFSVKDRVGVLYDTLKCFKKNKINLTKIESRPSKKKAWSYYFFVDFNKHCEDKNVKKTLKELEKHCVYLKVLGSYPVSQ